MQFYYNSKRKGTAAHIWKDGDTFCTMLSTGGIRPNGNEIQEKSGNRRICIMCKNNFEKLFLKLIWS